MYSFKIVTRKRGVFVGKNSIELSLTKRKRRNVVSIAFLCRVIVFGSLFIPFISERGMARISSPGNVTFSDPAMLNTTATFDSTGTFVLQQATFDGAQTTTKTVTVTVLGAILPRVCMGTGSAIGGNSVDIQMAFSTGTLAVAGFQYDLVLPAGVSSNTVTAGSVITNAGKSIQANLVGTSLRIIIFGLNQTTIDSGILGSVNLRLATSMTSGILPLSLINVTGSDVAGINVPMTSCNGTLTITANKAPITTIGANQTITLPATASLTATATDDGAPNPPGILTYSWSVL